MPYSNEHAARLRNPADFQPGSFRRINGRFGAGIDPIYGRLKGETVLTVQAIRFDARRFTEEAARKWLSAHNYKPISFEPATKSEKSNSAKAHLKAHRKEIGMGQPDQKIQATVPDLLAMSSGDPIEINASGDGEKKQKKFKMNAYSGGIMELSGWFHPVVVDLDGMSIPRKSRPILRSHDSSKIVGHSDSIQIENGKLLVNGIVSDATEAGREVSSLAEEGFPWQASLGARAIKVIRKEDGEKATVNGREFSGPIMVVRKSILNEVSFVPLGADDSTSATVAASAAGAITVESEGGKSMPKTKEKEVEASGTPETEAEEPTVELEHDVNAEGHGDIIEKIRAESSRIASINIVCKDSPEIAAQATKDGWSPEKAELHVLKAEKTRKEQDSKVSSPPVTAEGKNSDLQAMKAAFLLGKVSEKDVAKNLGEKAIQGAEKFRRLGLREMIAVAASLDGVALRPGMSEKDWVRAAFSSISVTELLSDSANKALLAAYQAVPSSARVLAKALSANDFKIHKGIRLTSDLLFKKVDNGGEITHGTLGEDSFSYSVDTYGRLIGLTRQDLKNDDLGAFLQLPILFGRGAALAVEKAFWTLVLANTGSFFSGGNDNYISGATTGLSISSLSAAEQLLAEMVDANDDPILIMGKYLVIPPALTATAQQIYTSTKLIDGTATDLQGDANIHAGKYQPVSSPYLKDVPKAWYLFGDPADIAAFGIAWLDGVQVPTVEEVEVGPEYLGRAWRGYIDFGVCQIDKRGAMKSKGEA